MVIRSRQSSTPADVLVGNFNPYNLANRLNQGIELSTTTSAGVVDCPCFSTFYHVPR